MYKIRVVNIWLREEFRQNGAVFYFSKFTLNEEDKRKQFDVSETKYPQKLKRNEEEYLQLTKKTELIIMFCEISFCETQKFDIFKTQDKIAEN
ncbi:hypothetical protein HUJ04_008100 [Dendroctonus ponderosae]|nr:hypothetical protein HUJ04_008100 [Dendroctonus ponderosae]